MPRQKLPRTTTECARTGCGTTFEVIGNKADVGRHFCSRSCARQVENAERSIQKQQEWYDSEKSLCACGANRIPYPVRHTTKYCSPACRGKYGKKKQPKPENHVTFTCQNCQAEVTRPRSWGKGYFKYCSNECARRHTKTRRFYGIEGLDVVFESSWEALFWGLCGFRKLPIERYDREQGVEWQEGAWYAPDFWLPTLDLAVEIKGQPDEDDDEKWTAFRTTRRLAVIGRAEMRLLLADEDLVNGIATITKP